MAPRNHFPTEWSWDKQDNIPTDDNEHQGHHHHPHLSLQDAKDWYRKRHASRRVTQRRSSLVLQRQTTGKRIWKFTLRPWNDDEYQDWWFAGTAIPLLAATSGPLANVFSIAALVTYWRMCLVRGVDNLDAAAQCHWNGDPRTLAEDVHGHPFRDPHWCYNLNCISLAAGLIGNLSLLCNFTGRIRYIIALPVTIVMWYIATGILIGITVGMSVYVPPISPQETYTQGFWYAVFAAIMYMVSTTLLMVNMLGYFLGHYPQQFSLTESQRTLILQNILFFVWLAGGGAVFSTVEQKFGKDPAMRWSYVNGLYFCDVTILTVGFGDLYVTSNLGRGLLFPYSVGGIIMLGLMVSSIAKFATELGSDKIIRKHVEHSRARTVGRTVTTSLELEAGPKLEEGERPTISNPFDPVDRSRATAVSFADGTGDGKSAPPRTNTLQKVASFVTKPARPRQPKLILLREERDRFNAMRHIQGDTARFKRWYALTLSVIAFGILWCVGAAVFWRMERKTQGMTYFEALYFCYVSLLTIGYGDLAPKSNAGRPFFVLWSLIAIPTMTILVSDLGETVINKFKHGTFKLADFTVLPKYGVWREFLERHPWMLNWLQKRKEIKEAKRRITEGFQAGPEPEAPAAPPTIEELAKEEPPKEELAAKLAKKIRQTADEMKAEPNKRYAYEEWVEFTQLIRFTAKRDENGILREDRAEDEALIEWDWIGEDSPMMSRSGEPEFVLDRLCESMHRYIKHNVGPRSSDGDNVSDGKQLLGDDQRYPDSDSTKIDEDVSPGGGHDSFDARRRQLSSRRQQVDSSPSSSSGE